MHLSLFRVQSLSHGPRGNSPDRPAVDGLTRAFEHRANVNNQS
jgi:hypothetical protein